MTAFEQSFWSTSEPGQEPSAWPQPAPLEPVSDVGLELSEKLQRLLEAVDGLGESPPDGTGPEVIDAEDAPLHLVATGRETLPQRADQSTPSLIIKYEAGVELRFSGQSADFLERLLRVSADLDALARALPPTGGGEAGIAEPSAR